ncbi:MAG TPA: hypothetical protein VFQ35_21005, partial [Polyangiaceae bacterium]|nr:hypothetical protein [Polyangiaceae bacterium]
ATGRNLGHPLALRSRGILVEAGRRTCPPSLDSIAIALAGRRAPIVATASVGYVGFRYGVSPKRGSQ